MTPARRLVSSLLLGGGIVLVFAGMNAALGFSLPGMVASVAAIAGLLYAGALWARTERRDAANVLVFDHSLKLTGGEPLLTRFPAAQQDEIRAKAIATLAGARASFVVDGRNCLMTPLLSDSGAVLYGAVVETQGERKHAPV